MDQDNFSFNVSFKGQVNLGGQLVFPKDYSCVIHVPKLLSEDAEIGVRVKQEVYQQARTLYLQSVEEFVISSKMDNAHLSRPQMRLATALYNKNWFDEVTITELSQAH